MQTKSSASITEEMMARRTELLGIRLVDFRREVKDSQRAISVSVGRIVALRGCQARDAIGRAAGDESQAYRTSALGSSGSSAALRSLRAEKRHEPSVEEYMDRLSSAVPEYLMAVTKMSIGLIELGRSEEAIDFTRQKVSRYLEMGHRVPEILLSAPTLHAALMEMLKALNGRIVDLGGSGSFEEAERLTVLVVRMLDNTVARMDASSPQLLELDISLRHKSTQFSLQVGDYGAARRSLHSGMRKYRILGASFSTAGDVQKASNMHSAEQELIDLSIVLESHISAEEEDGRSSMIRKVDELASGLADVRRMIDAVVIEPRQMSKEDRPGSGGYL